MRWHTCGGIFASASTQPYLLEDSIESKKELGSTHQQTSSHSKNDDVYRESKRKQTCSDCHAHGLMSGFLAKVCEFFVVCNINFGRVAAVEIVGENPLLPGCVMVLRPTEGLQQ